MTYANAALSPDFLLGGAACVGVICLLFVSAVVLAVVLFRRSRRAKS